MSYFNSKNTFFILVIIAICASFYYKNWTTNWFLTNGDSTGYYAYLPATFIHHDLFDLNTTTYHRVKTLIDVKGPHDVPTFVQTGTVINGKRMIQYTSGVAIMQAPFFFLAHIVAKPLGYEANGYTLPYKMIVLFGNVFYVLLGLWVTRAILRGFFSEFTVSISLILVFLATNLFYFTVYSAYMSHSFLFCLYALLIERTIYFYKNPKIKTLFFIGIITGLITIMRPIDGFIAVVPLLYGVFSWADFKQRFLFFLNKKLWVAVGLIGMLLTMLPQLCYWKYITGQWFFYSYLGQSFIYKIHRVREGLIGFNNGWLIYTPIMFFSLLGIYFLWKKRDASTAIRLPLALFLPAYLCMIYFWWCNSYINGFGSRPMIDTYALMSIPLSMFIEDLKNKRFLFGFWLIIAAFCTWLNIFNTYQMVHHLIVSERSNATFWWLSLGKTKYNYQDIIAFDADEIQPRENETTLKKVLLSQNFEDTTNQNVVKSPVYEGQYAGELKAHTTGQTVEVRGKDVKAYKWLKIKGWFYTPAIDILSFYDKTAMVLHIRNDKKTIRWATVNIDTKIGNDYAIYGGQAQKWGCVWFYARIPEKLKDDDIISAYLWNTSERPFYVDNFQIELHD
jgi:hypothetical protein